jgi:adenosine deaminase
MDYSAAKADSDGVIIRFGHATQTTPDQAKLMAKMGIIAEVNLGSNAATGAVIPTEGRKLENGTLSVPATPGVKPSDVPTIFDDHAFLHLLYDQVPVVLNTDAQGVMHTTLGEEYATAAWIIEQFRNGKITMTIDGKVTHYGDLPADVKTRFDMNRLVEAAEAYQARIKSGKVPQ